MQKLVNVDYFTPIIVYCKKGIRATGAERILTSAGFENVLMLGGTTIKPLLCVMNGVISIPYLDVCYCQT